jgi:hypothetical protein
MNRFFMTLAVATATAFTPAPMFAGTIIKLGFGTDSKPDLELVDGVISTFDDGFGATIGDQNTELTFLGALSGALVVENDRASFTLENVVTDGTPTLIGTTLLQPTSGGNFLLYGPSNELLLSGTLGDGILSGPIGGTATGGFLTAQFGDFTGGSLLATLNAADLYQSSLSFGLTDVNDGGGLRIANGEGEDGRLLPFSADATANIGGQVPEPTSSLLLISAAVGAVLIGRRR